MATAMAVRQKPRTDDIFFTGMTLLILLVVFLGFAKSYFLAGMLGAKLPNILVHIHGALFVTWTLLLLLQTTLVATGKVKLHTTLGVCGFVLIPVMVVVAVLTLFDSIRRNGVAVAPELLLVGDLVELGLFAALTCWALLARRDSASHKRLMVLGTLAMLGPAIDRWPFPIGRPFGAVAIGLALPLLVAAYDLWSIRRVHRSTRTAYAIILGAYFLIFPVAQLPLWHHVVAWIRHT
jgi:hypothetical protein